MVDRSQRAVDRFKELGMQLEGISSKLSASADIDAAREDFRAWDERAKRVVAEELRDSEAARLGEALQPTGPTPTGSTGDLAGEIAQATKFILAVIFELFAHPGEILTDRPLPPSEPGRVDIPEVEQSARVFIVHGCDETSLNELEGLIRDEFKLVPVVLREQAGGSAALLEKLEQHDPAAGFAFFLVTPDDFMIEIRGDEEYVQARSNVLIELGWLCARLGRDRVVLLCKDNAGLPSEISGLRRIDFFDSVRDKFLDIRAELIRAELVEPQR